MPKGSFNITLVRIKSSGKGTAPIHFTSSILEGRGLDLFSLLFPSIKHTSSTLRMVSKLGKLSYSIVLYVLKGQLDNPHTLGYRDILVRDPSSKSEFYRIGIYYINGDR